MTRPIEIIAEAGVNHNGNMELAIRMIKEAKMAGADVIKFQLYDPRKRGDIEEHKWKDVLLESRLTKRQLHLLKDECDKIDIEFMCSVFDVERVGWLEQVGVKRYKIASKSIYDEELVDSILATGKEVIMSYGLIEEGRRRPLEAEIIPFRLYCVSEYPTDLSKVKFMYPEPYYGTIFEDFYDGFSDHTIGITASVVAMSLGARIIEKHFTMDKSMPGPDHFLSVEPGELRMLCKMRNDIERILY